MPEAGFDRNINLPTSGGRYFRLKKQGDKIKFLIANPPHYETKHWVSDSEPVMCNKYNGQEKGSVCDFCDQHKTLVEEASGDKELLKEANKIKPQTTFFYPVLNLDTDEAVIFQTAQSVHWTIVGYKEEGVDVFECAWVVERTEEPGKYYEVRRLDKIKLNLEQQEVFENAKNIKLDKGQVSKTVVEEKSFDLTDEELEEMEKKI